MKIEIDVDDIKKFIAATGDWTESLLEV